MDLVDVVVSPLQREHRLAFARTARDASFPVVGEHVVLRDQDGRYFSGLVLESAADEGGRGMAHRLRVGVALPEYMAVRRLGRPACHAAPAGDLNAGDLHADIAAYLEQAAAFTAAYGTA